MGTQVSYSQFESFENQPFVIVDFAKCTYKRVLGAIEMEITIQASTNARAIFVMKPICVLDVMFIDRGLTQ